MLITYILIYCKQQAGGRTTARTHTHTNCKKKHACSLVVEVGHHGHVRPCVCMGFITLTFPIQGS